MPQYAAVLGHQPHISIAELAAAVPGFTPERTEQNAVLLFSSAEELDAEFFDALGGSVMIARRITDADVAMSDIPRLLCAEVAGVKKKVTFGLRCYGVPKPEIKRAYRMGKEALRKQERPCRYIGNEHKPAATALLLGSDILGGKRGTELFIVGSEHGLWVGRTVAAQDIDAYTRRDMRKPVRDTTVGLLPPKLAQVMLNLGAWAVRAKAAQIEQLAKQEPSKRKKRETYTVLDPFCGTGVIPMECLLRGWNVIASDASLKAVNGCAKNLEWLRKDRKILKKDVADSVEKHDATKPFAFKQPPDMVVTETSLGPAMTKHPSARDLQKIRKECEALEAAFLRNAAKTLPGVPLVCCFPFWRSGGTITRLEKVWDAVAETGYAAVLPDGISGITEKKSLLYQRKDQYVGREIVVLVPKG